MSVEIFICESCDTAAFPPRLLCPRCGCRHFRSETVEHATLENFCDRGEVKLGTVRVPQGPLLIVRLYGDPTRGSRVALDEDGNVPVARA